MGSRKNLIKELEKFAKDISQSYPLEKMFLFGSRARGRVKESSDVDLLIVSPKFRKRRKLKRSPPLYLKWDLDYPVDFLCLTPEEFRRKSKQVGVVQDVIKKGIEIK